MAYRKRNEVVVPQPPQKRPFVNGRKGVASGRTVLPLISQRSKASWLAALREALCQECVELRLGVP